MSAFMGMFFGNIHEDPNKILLGNNLVSTVVAPISTRPSSNFSPASPEETHENYPGKVN